MSSSDTYQLEIFVPGGPEHPRTRIPFLGAALSDDWMFNEGHVHWVAAGTTLLDDGFDLYPMDQLNAVIGVVELALAGKAGVVPVGGSIIQLSTAPTGPKRVTLSRTLPARHINARIHNEAEHVEVVVPVARLARHFIDSARLLMTHPDLLIPSHRPSSGGSPTHGFPEMIARLDALDTACRRIEGTTKK